MFVKVGQMNAYFRWQLLQPSWASSGTIQQTVHG